MKKKTRTATPIIIYLIVRGYQIVIIIIIQIVIIQIVIIIIIKISCTGPREAFG